MTKKLRTAIPTLAQMKVMTKPGDTETGTDEGDDHTGGTETEEQETTPAEDKMSQLRKKNQLLLAQIKLEQALNFQPQQQICLIWHFSG